MLNCVNTSISVMLPCIQHKKENCRMDPKIDLKLQRNIDRTVRWNRLLGINDI